MVLFPFVVVGFVINTPVLRSPADRRYPLLAANIIVDPEAARYDVATAAADVGRAEWRRCYE